jgi:hypothetical protein
MKVLWSNIIVVLSLAYMAFYFSGILPKNEACAFLPGAIIYSYLSYNVYLNLLYHDRQIKLSANRSVLSKLIKTIFMIEILFGIIVAISCLLLVIDGVYSGLYGGKSFLDNLPFVSPFIIMFLPLMAMTLFLFTWILLRIIGAKIVAK